MYGLLKFGYLLVGIGIGGFASSFVLDYELNKPIGEIEEYIPREDRDDTENNQESDQSGRKNNRKSKENNQKDISSDGRNGRGNSSRRSGEGGSHSEFGASQDDLYHFYSSNEDRLRNPNFGKEGQGDKATQDSDTGEMSEGDKRRKEFEARRSESIKNMKTRYSKMYNYITKSNDEIEEANKGGDDMNDILHQVNVRTNTRESYVQDNEPDDIDEDYLNPDPFELDIHKEYDLEPIEGQFEVFLDECPLLETIPLTYYAGDYTLCDDGDQIIPDPEDVVGMAALNRLMEGGPGVHDEVIFVHNTYTNLNYEVMLEPGTYKESVAGLIDEKFSNR